MAVDSSLSISITEQPTEFHRFRYETEVSGGKLGGLLYGRSGKNCVRLRVTGIDTAVHQAVIVIGGTVNPDGFPHPFFMVGDGCSDGAFQFKKDVAALGGKRELEISLEKVALICVSTKGDKLAEAITNRKRINFNPFSKDIDSAKYNSRNLKSVRLVFQVYYQDVDNQPVATKAIAISDVISDAKQQVKLGIYGIHPDTVSVAGAQDVWIYFDEPLPHIDHSAFTAEIHSVEHGVLPCRVVEARKHLIIVQKPDARDYFESSNERVKCDLVVKETRAAISESHDIILFRSSAMDRAGLQVFLTDPPQKRKRAKPHPAPHINMFDLLQ